MMIQDLLVKDMLEMILLVLRNDIVGTLKCITIDYQTLEDNTVTIRDRNSMNQIRVKIEDIEKYL